MVKPKTSLLPAPWKLNAFWLNLFPSHATVCRSITEFLAANQDQVDLLQSWDAFKAFLRGVFIGQVGGVIRNMRSFCAAFEQWVRQLEQMFIDNPTDSTRWSWLSAQNTVNCVEPPQWMRSHSSLNWLTTRKVNKLGGYLSKWPERRTQRALLECYDMSMVGWPIHQILSWQYWSPSSPLSINQSRLVQPMISRSIWAVSSYCPPKTRKC